MLELLFLLLPIAAAYGWYMGQRSAQQSRQQEANRLSRDYVAGVDFLLSHQEDKAAELFLNMLEADNDKVEAHLALGNLFRSRGEVDRALRIHQTLLDNPVLNEEQRLLTIQQLGRDHMAAGLYDRAESMFNQLVDEQDFRENALQQLLLIYQSTGEWQHAVETAGRLVKLGKEQPRRDIAHFYCELAVQAWRNGDRPRSMALLKKGATADKDNARVSIMSGQLLLEQGQYQLAVDSLQRVLKQDKDLVSETLVMLETCYQHLNQPEQWVAYLRRCVAEDTGAAAELYLADRLERDQGAAAAQNYLCDQLSHHPNLRVFYRLIDYQWRAAEAGSAKNSLLVLKDLVSEQLRVKPRYRCQKCGFTAQTLYWHCPACRNWSTVKPIRGMDGQ